MFGVATDEDVFILASRDLTQVELEAVYEEQYEEIFGLDRRLLVDRQQYVDFQGQAHTFFRARGATYAEAVRVLFETWNPDSGVRISELTTGDEGD
jgi:hypothetical protein